MGYKMKGSPMQRNFGISPMKDEEMSKAMKRKVEDVKEVNFKETNAALVAQGKPAMTRDEYDAGLNKGKN